MDRSRLRRMWFSEPLACAIVSLMFQVVSMSFPKVSLSSQTGFNEFRVAEGKCLRECQLSQPRSS